MGRFNAVADTMHECLTDLTELLFGCAHRRTTFPMTVRPGLAGGEEQGTQPQTYIACLECGRHFAYDWSTMRAGRRRIAWAAPPPQLPALEEARRGSR
jgi:hypothetical protein